MHEVYAVDVLVSSGEGKAKDAGQRTTIYKRDPSKQYGLKMKTSRAFFSEVERRFDAMPFTLRYYVWQEQYWETSLTLFVHPGMVSHPLALPPSLPCSPAQTCSS